MKYNNSKTALLSILFLISAFCQASNEIYTINGFTMGTTYSVKIVEKSLDTHKVGSDIDNILHSINMDMSTYIDSSSISIPSDLISLVNTLKDSGIPASITKFPSTRFL